jgi:hypothetical protein
VLDISVYCKNIKPEKNTNLEYFIRGNALYPKTIDIGREECIGA